MLSVHTSPLDQPGAGDAGGMNVYVLELARALARRGAEVEIFTRATSSAQPVVVDVEPGVRVLHVPAGPFEGLDKNDLPGQLCAFTAGVLRAEAHRPPGWYDVVHSHYWLSGQVGWLAAERWDVPLVHTMHTTARVKNAALAPGDLPEPAGRIIGEEQVVEAADALVASTREEADDLVRDYGADPGRVHVIPPGVDLTHFHPLPPPPSSASPSSLAPSPPLVLAAAPSSLPSSPPLPLPPLSSSPSGSSPPLVSAAPSSLPSSSPSPSSSSPSPSSPSPSPSSSSPPAWLPPSSQQRALRARLGLPDGPLVLFAGRVQLLKGPDVLVQALAHLPVDVRLVVLGGASGRPTAVRELEALAHQCGVRDRVLVRPPVARAELADWYRAADVVAVPSHNESFGLVAAEAQACGTPVVAAAVGGLRTVVQDGVTGVLVEGHDPRRWAQEVGALLDDDARRARLAAGAAASATRFGWDAAASDMLDVYAKARTRRRNHLGSEPYRAWSGHKRASWGP